MLERNIDVFSNPELDCRAGWSCDPLAEPGRVGIQPIQNVVYGLIGSTGDAPAERHPGNHKKESYEFIEETKDAGIKVNAGTEGKIKPESPSKIGGGLIGGG